MKARRLKEILGPLAYPVAKSAGYSRSYWDYAISKDLNIAGKYQDALHGALEEVKKEVLKQFRQAKKEAKKEVT